MSSFPNSPRLIKGAIISLNLPSPIPEVIIFQYNPDTLTRRLTAQGKPSGGGDRTETFKIIGPPSETISLEVEIDATDQLERPNQNITATSMGIYPQLSSLEMILYPKVELIKWNAVLSAAGSTSIASSEGPFTLFIWGPKRILPVRLTELNITEEAHDPNLNPIRAKVSFELQVLSYSDFKSDQLGFYIFMAHHVMKEAMAAIGTINNVGAIVGGNISLF